MSGSVSRRALLGGSVAAVAAAALGCGGPTGVVRPTGTAAARLTGPARPTGAAAAGARPSRTGTPAPTPVAHRPADSATIRDRATVPVLCWHQLRDWTGSDSAYDRRALICPPANFRGQLDALAAHGYRTIGPDQYLDHLTTGAPLPAKPVLLTFDDSQGSQISVGLPELVRRRMTAAFFVMTVVLDKPRWMRRTDLRRLDAAGMTVAAHTWDHSRADRYGSADWQPQLVAPKAELERILGKPVRHFAYPYGAWDRADFPHLTEAGYASAYQLGDAMDAGRPLLTLRRTLVDSTWTGADLLARLHR